MMFTNMIFTITMVNSTIKMCLCIALLEVKCPSHGCSEAANRVAELLPVQRSSVADWSATVQPWGDVRRSGSGEVAKYRLCEGAY